MPKGPQGQKRPADVVSAAVMVGRIATGEAKETLAAARTPSAEMGSKGGKVRAANMTPKQRSKAAKAAAKARWKKDRVDG